VLCFAPQRLGVFALKVVVYAPKLKCTLSIWRLSWMHVMWGRIMIKIRALDGARMHEDAARQLAARLNGLAGERAP
jgi:hypothetical protein